MFELFSTREVASITYLLLIFFVVILRAKSIALFANLIKSLLKKVFIIPVLFLLAYAALIVFGLQFLPFWDWLLIKDIIIWVLFIATPICFKAAVNRKKNQYPFKRMVIDNFVWSAILEFFVGAFTFSFVAELVVVPAFSLLVLLQNHDRENEKLKDVHKLIDGISVVAGLVLLGITVNAAIDVIKDEGITSVLVSFCIPIIFSIAFLPVVYMLAVRGKYHDLFFRIKIRNNGDERDLKIKKKAILRVCGLSYKKLCKFEHGYYSEYITAIHSGNDDETLLQFIKNFKG